MEKPRLTIGMATFDDFEGTYWTIQSLRLFQPEALEHCELLVVDNNPQSAHGPLVQGLIENWVNPRHRARYIPFPEAVGTSASRNRVFQEAAGDSVLCLDSHVMLEPGSLKRLLNFYASHPECLDLLSGPMYYDGLSSVVTHFDDVWRGEMWGIWGIDPRGNDLNGDPFEIPAMGLGMFTCRKSAWLGFNPHARGFGGEEFYIHTKFRAAGRKCLCLPFLRWLHRFGRPGGVPYPLTQWNKVRNYVLELNELGIPLDRVHKHFVRGEAETLPDGSLAQGTITRMSEDLWNYLVADPIGRVAPGPTEAEVEVKPAPAPGGCGGCPQDQAGVAGAGVVVVSAPVTDLETLYVQAASTQSDMYVHLPKLRELASQCQRVTEFGQRQGTSCVALLAAQPAVLRSYDWNDAPLAPLLKAWQGKTDFEFIKANVLEVDIEPTDLLFIDTFHTAAQLSAELARHADKVSRWIVMHDTEIFGEQGEDGSPGLLVALRQFLRERPEWGVVYRTEALYGLTVISRVEGDKRPIPSLAERAVTFAKHSWDHLLDKLTPAEKTLAETRLDICAICEYRNEEKCSVCGCPVAAKAGWRSSYCDKGFWPL